jgi:large subunit ribosomal protein L5
MAEAKGKKKGKKEQAAAEEAPQVPEEPVVPRMKQRYREEVVPALMREFGYANPMQAPRMSKVCLNMGVGTAIQDPKTLEAAVAELAQITGQRPAVTRAKRSIASFRVRAKMPIGCKVTLRGNRMYEFLDRLFNAALPRIRDFRGLATRSVDGRGNYSLGIREQTIFPEIDLDKVDRIRGMDIIMVTTAKTDEEARALLRLLGLPFREA